MKRSPTWKGLAAMMPFAAMLTVGCGGPGKVPTTAVNGGPQPAAVIVTEASYPGANAQVVADTLAAPIEQQVNGVENLLHLASRSTDDGRYVLAAAFKPGTDLDEARERWFDLVAENPGRVRSCGTPTGVSQLNTLSGRRGRLTKGRGAGPI